MQAAPQLIEHRRYLQLKQPDVLLQIFDAGPRDRPAVVLIHGLQDEADTWRHVFQPLAQRQRVIAFDLPGFGRSDKAPRRYDMPFFADVVVGLLDALRLTHATLVGSSLGGMIAESVALAHPARARRLILVDGTLALVKMPAGGKDLLTRLLFQASSDKRMFDQLRRSPDAAFATLEPYYADITALPKAERDFLYQRVNERVHDEPQRLASLSVQRELPLFFARNTRRLVDKVAKSPVPTTVIWGEQDHILAIANGHARAALQPGAQFIPIAGAGHLPHQERPAAFLAALQAAGLAVA